MSHTASDIKHLDSPRDIAHSFAAVAPALAAILLGALLLYGVGFAQPTAIHDAAHDSRHSLAFPCH